MKKKLLVFTIFLLFVNQIQAREIPGYFITNNLDTVKAVFSIPLKLLSEEPNYESIQFKIKYLDSKNEKQILKPETAVEIFFELDGEEITMLSRQNSLYLSSSMFSTNKMIFLRLIKDGEVKLFKYYYSSSAGMNNMAGKIDFEKYIIQKNEDKLFELNPLKFKKDILKFVFDCSEVVEKIENKIYRMKDIEEIIDEYNSCK